MIKRVIISSFLVMVVMSGWVLAAEEMVKPEMYYADTSRGKPYSKDPDIIPWKDYYLMYFSVPPYGDRRENDGWSIGIAKSDDLINWKMIAEVPRDKEYEKRGACAPAVEIIKGKIHIFYQSYGSGATDAICHAVSDDGIHFTKDATNPIFHPEGEWTCGRAIDAEVIEHKGTLYLYCATRDKKMEYQKLAVATADINSDFGRDAWTQREVKDSILQPELPWEKKCIEAPALLLHNGTFYMFYAGGYNNNPQQVGVAVSKDGLKWKRMSDEPILPNGAKGEWNSSESGHPGTFIDKNGKAYLTFQGNNDMGRTWYLSKMRIEWDGDLPYLVRPRDGKEFRLKK